MSHYRYETKQMELIVFKKNVTKEYNVFDISRNFAKVIERMTFEEIENTLIVSQIPYVSVRDNLVFLEYKHD